MVDIPELRRQAMRLGTTDLVAAQLLQAAGDEIEQLRVQRDALLPVPLRAARPVVQAPARDAGVRP